MRVILLGAPGSGKGTQCKWISKEYDGKVRVVNARTVKPLDVNFLEGITSKVVITLEENAVIGGFGQAVSAYYTNSPIKVFNLGVRDEFITHGTRANQLKYSRAKEEGESKGRT